MNFYSRGYYNSKDYNILCSYLNNICGIVVNISPFINDASPIYYFYNITKKTIYITNNEKKEEDIGVYMSNKNLVKAILNDLKKPNTHNKIDVIETIKNCSKRNICTRIEDITEKETEKDIEILSHNFEVINITISNRKAKNNVRFLFFVPMKKRIYVSDVNFNTPLMRKKMNMDGNIFTYISMDKLKVFMKYMLNKKIYLRNFFINKLEKC